MLGREKGWQNATDEEMLNTLSMSHGAGAPSPGPSRCVAQWGGGVGRAGL